MYKPKVFYTASYSGKKKYQKDYDMILNALKKSDIELIGTEVGNYKSLISEKDRKECKTERELHYRAIRKGIKWADLLVLELSQESFQVGHEATIALNMKKHVLGLSVNRNWEETINDRYFHGAKYNKYFINEIIKDFIEKYSRELLTERFNMFLSDSQVSKLEKIAAKKEMNMSEIMRQLLDEASI